MKWLLIPFALLLAGCDSGPPPPKTEHAADPVFGTQTQAVRKAHAVEGQVMDAADAQRKQIDAATQQ
ncbi:MAG: YdgH/BhsA/McbA family protein [Thiobacillus sp.]